MPLLDLKLLGTNCYGWRTSKGSFVHGRPSIAADGISIPFANGRRAYRFWRSAAQCLLGGIAVALVTFVCFRLNVTVATAALLYLIVVLLSSLTGSFVLSAVVSVIAILCLDYFFTEPRFNIDVTLREPIHLLALITFLGTALVITNLMSKVRKSFEVLREQAGLLNLTHDTVFVRDMNDVITYWNRGAEERYGWTSEEAVGKVFHRLMQTIFPVALKVINSALLRTGCWEGEVVHTKRDGTQVIVASRWSLQRDEQGRPLATLETNNDITERKRAEDALRQSEFYLAEAQKLTHTGTYAFCPSTPERSYWSSEYYRIYGFDPAKDPARRSAVLERIHPDDRARVDRKFKEAIHKKTDFDTSFRVVLPDGTEKHLHAIVHPIVDPGGEVVEFVGTSMDVTEQYQDRAALEKAFEEIRALKDQLYKENLALWDEVDRTSMFEEIVGTSTAMRAVLSRIAKVAPTDSTVLITGETGTGKELIARAIHKRSQRSGRAFVSVNCTAMAPSLISSELFGHEKGSFTGATQRRLGRFELADGGTIFLDEVGELPPDTQAALLRVLQEREFERVGGERSIQVDVRVIAATNRDLKAAKASGACRSDLFYRLNVFPIEVPPLRERKDDILMLLEYFVKRFASRTGKNIRSIDKKTLELFQSYSWPGNIRELQNVIERSVILSSGDVFSVDESWLSKESAQMASPPLASQPVNGESRDELEIIKAALAESRGRVSGPSGAAAKLGVPPSTLEYRIKALEIRKSQFKFR
jgi:PAS domain S-box-containing protein